MSEFGPIVSARRYEPGARPTVATLSLVLWRRRHVEEGNTRHFRALTPCGEAATPR